MWYTDNEKLDIGRRVYTHEISKEQAWICGTVNIIEN